MEYINTIMFYLNAAIVIITTLGVIFAKKIMSAVFSALICFLGVGLLFFSLNAPFNAVIQISIYGVALSVLFTVAIMITHYKNEEKQKIKIYPRMLLSVIGVLMIIFSVIIFLKETLKYEPLLMMYVTSSEILTSQDNIIQLSSELLTHNIYAFEFLGVYILIVLIGIAVLITYKGETK